MKNFTKSTPKTDRGYYYVITKIQYALSKMIKDRTPPIEVGYIYNGFVYLLVFEYIRTKGKIKFKNRFVPKLMKVKLTSIEYWSKKPLDYIKRANNLKRKLTK